MKRCSKWVDEKSVLFSSHLSNWFTVSHFIDSTNNLPLCRFLPHEALALLSEEVKSNLMCVVEPTIVCQIRFPRRRRPGNFPVTSEQTASLRRLGAAVKTCFRKQISIHGGEVLQIVLPRTWLSVMLMRRQESLVHADARAHTRGLKKRGKRAKARREYLVEWVDDEKRGGGGGGRRGR